MNRLLLVASVLALTASGPAWALSTQECSVKYQAAKEAGTLGGLKWNDFRKAQCGADAAPAAAAPAAPAAPAQATKPAAPAAPAQATAPATAEKGLTAQQCSAKYQAAKAANTLDGMKWNDFRKDECGPGAEPLDSDTAAPAAPSGGGTAIFPAKVDPKYSSEKEGRQRLKTCVDQYNANKTAGGAGNGGLKWIMKGGGYWSECTKRLKGA